MSTNNSRWRSTKYYKSYGFTNALERYDLTGEVTDYSITNPVTQPVWTESQSIQGLPFLVKSAWNTEFWSNGISEIEVIFGPRKRTQFKQFINMKVSELGLNRDVNIKQGNGIMTDFERMISYNKLTGDYGWYNVPVNATYGEMLYQTKETSFITRRNYSIPSEDKLAEMQAAGLVQPDFTVNDPFKKSSFTVPAVRSWKPEIGYIFEDVLQGNRLCSSFFYRNAQDKTINQYKDWHSKAWIKRPGHEMQINRMGAGRNFIIPLDPVPVKAGEPGQARKSVLLNPGKPVLLESSTCAVHRDHKGFILHVYEINTQ